MNLVTDTIETPLGEMTAVVRGRQLVLLDFSDCPERIERLLSRRFGEVPFQSEENPVGIRTRLDAYFAGERDAFCGLVLEPFGTDFQKSVWKALLDIPYGEAISYGTLAKQVGRPKAHRAAGTANGQNPIAIIIPCHRVIANNGTLAGYAGGVNRKQWLLEFEGKHAT